MGLTFVRGSGLDLTADSDANYADKSKDRRSVLGTVITPWGVLPSIGQVAHRSVLRCLQQKQSVWCVTLSTAEAECVALGEGVMKALFAGAVVSFIYPELSESCVRVFEDNQGAIALGENPLSSARSNHIDVRFHFVRKLLRARKLAFKP